MKGRQARTRFFASATVYELYFSLQLPRKCKNECVDFRQDKIQEQNRLRPFHVAWIPLADTSTRPNDLTCRVIESFSSRSFAFLTAGAVQSGTDRTKGCHFMAGQINPAIMSMREFFICYMP